MILDTDSECCPKLAIGRISSKMEAVSVKKWYASEVVDLADPRPCSVAPDHDGFSATPTLLLSLPKMARVCKSLRRTSIIKPPPC